ncbi:type III pantothenate kinase [Desulfosarcina sp. OttesenSCG-928-A07]|nr:type III pantothenate kinase [Desulfosarcina sp. OttesenSCG-928-A07]
MLLTLDVSNSTIKAGIFDGEKLTAFWQVATERHKVADNYAVLFLNLFHLAGVDVKTITGVSMSCVVPRLRAVFTQLCTRYIKLTPFVVGPDVKMPILLDMDYPSEVGGDRIANASAAYALYGGPVIDIAFGTATVFDCISERGAYLGGAIAPGMMGALESLVDRAAQLFKVEMVRPPQAIGKNSMHALQSGMVFGFSGLVEQMVRRLKAELAQDSAKPVTVVATGGLADVIAPETRAITVVDHQLTLKGLRLIYEVNR